jgi:hypothetical protein
MHPASFEHSVKARTAIDLAVRKVDLLDYGFEPGIFPLVLAHFALAPSIIAADRNIQSPAQQRDCVLLTVLSDELELHTWPREKMPIAFVNLSRSCRRRSFSRFKWRISSSCGVLGPLDARYQEMLAHPAR